MPGIQRIASHEKLGRAVFSASSAKRARKRDSRVPFHEFLPRAGDVNLSVDRLSMGPIQELCAHADGMAEQRSTPQSQRSFYGWAEIVAEDAATGRRCVQASPQFSNPYHADIILPSDAAEDREEQKKHAQQLANMSYWRERPSSN